MASASAPDHRLSARWLVRASRLESASAAVPLFESRATRSSEAQVSALALNAATNSAGVVAHLYCCSRSR